MEAVAGLHSGSLPYIGRHLSAAGREAMLHGSDPVRSFGDHRQAAGTVQRCSSPELTHLAGMPRTASATAAQRPGSFAAGGSQGCGVILAAAALPPPAGTAAAGAVATAATAAAAHGAATDAGPASEEPATGGMQEFQAMWQSVAAHHGLDPQLSLAHEQQLAEVTGGRVRRKKAAARYA
uniref:Uncharacterized protein n=1 Tax=Tetradesmus obliquus TaxID=3088 RepID=A0A383WBG6_TETOB|eukprot:jgi/Sobl393_1/42/SZX74781.1